MNQNGIVENLLGAFETWNEKLTELWSLVSTSPQDFKGGTVWTVMQNIHSGMLARKPALTMAVSISPGNVTIACEIPPMLPAI